MPRRLVSKKDATALKGVLFLIVIGALVHYLIAFISVIFAWIVSVSVYKIYYRGRAEKNLREKIASLVEQHLNSLIRRRAQLVTYDPYGKPIVDKWVKEIHYFVEEHILPALDTAAYATYKKNRNVPLIERALQYIY